MGKSITRVEITPDAVEMLNNILRNDISADETRRVVLFEGSVYVADGIDWTDDRTAMADGREDGDPYLYGWGQYPTEMHDSVTGFPLHAGLGSDYTGSGTGWSDIEEFWADTDTVQVLTGRPIEYSNGTTEGWAVFTREAESEEVSALHALTYPHIVPDGTDDDDVLNGEQLGCPLCVATARACIADDGDADADYYCPDDHDAENDTPSWRD